jgi:uncharacterized delta-60 repeat protein
MVSKGSYRKGYSIFKLGLTLLLAFSFSASAWAGEPEEQQAPNLPLSPVYLPVVMRLGPVQESSGILDPSFDSDGMVNTNISGSADYGWTLARQSDGKLLLAGNTWVGDDTLMDFTVVRYNPDGSLDTGFGSLGMVMTDFAGGEDWCRAMAVQSDGKIVMAGSAEVGEQADFALVRYNPDGSLDTSFDGDGKALTDFAGDYDLGRAIALQPDSKIVVAGYVYNGTNYDFAVARYNPDGSLDTTFSGDGMLALDFAGGYDGGRAIALQPDGKIVVAGFATGVAGDFAVVRINPNGSLDTSFDSDGMLTTDIAGGSDVGNAVALQPDGKIVVAGDTSDGTNQDFALVRYNPDGSLDLSLEGDGVVLTDIAGSYDQGFAVVLQGDGKIVVAGYATGVTGDFAVVRYNSNGSLDTGFDQDGIVVTDLAGRYDAGFAVVLQPDGKIVMAGRTESESSIDFAAARYNANGSLDSSFDGDGKVITNIKGAHDEAQDVILQPDGKIVAAGRADLMFSLVRYNPDGSLDLTFSGDGLVMTDFGDGEESIAALALQSDGKIVAAGFGWNDYNSDFALARYNPDGSLDTTFDGDGMVSTDLASSDDAGYGIALQADGKIVVVGYAYNGTNNDFAVVRYNPDGSLDGTFDGDGKLVTDFAGGDDEAQDVALQLDDKIVVVGSASGDFAVARYNPNGSLDGSFSSDGKVMTDFYGLEDGGNAVVLQSDGKIVVAGTGSNPAPGHGIAVVRYNPNGSLDMDFSNDGWVTLTSVGPNKGFDVALQTNNKIVVAGWKINFDDPAWHNDFFLARFNPNGSLDDTFDGDGTLVTDFTGGRDECWGIVLQPDGMIVAVGYMHNGEDDDFALARYK